MSNHKFSFGNPWYLLQNKSGKRNIWRNLHQPRFHVLWEFSNNSPFLLHLPLLLIFLFITPSIFSLPSPSNLNHYPLFLQLKHVSWITPSSKKNYAPTKDKNIHHKSVCSPLNNSTKTEQIINILQATIVAKTLEKAISEINMKLKHNLMNIRSVKLNIRLAEKISELTC